MHTPPPWNEHVDKLCSKVNRSISGLKQARDYVPLDVLNTIYKSLIQPVFDYCDVVWDNLDQGLATRIQKLQNRAARIITFQGYDVRSAQIRKQLNWEELASRRQRHLSLLIGSLRIHDFRTTTPLDCVTYLLRMPVLALAGVE